MGQRGRNTQYPDHQIQDREAPVQTTKFTDDDGNTVTVDGDNPLPVSGTDDSIIIMNMLMCLGNDILEELKKLNKGMESALDGEVL